MTKADELWTKAFWKATAERALSTGAQAVLLVAGGDIMTNAIDFDFKNAAGFFVGGVFLTVFKCLAGDAISGNGPSLVGAENLDVYQGRHADIPVSPVAGVPNDYSGPPAA